jgi:GcrA cell cycle regulator
MAATADAYAFWRDDAVDAALRRMIAGGYSGGKIAVALSAEFGRPLTRSAVIGRVNRLDLQFRARKSEQSSWTDDMVASLRELAALKYPLQRIADELLVRHGARVSSKAVDRKMRRLGITPPRQRKKDYATAVNPGNLTRRLPPLRPTTIIADLAIPQEQRCTLMQLNRYTCRWPIGEPKEADFFFCGAEPAPGSSYCRTHTMRAYAVAPVPERKAAA